jgi:hypothetical protein
VDDIVTTVYQNYVSLGEHVTNRMTDPPISPGFEYQGSVPTNAPTGITIAANDVIKIENKGVISPTAVGIAVIDLYVDNALEVCAFINTPGVEPFELPIYKGTNNFLPNDGTPAANCWGLASDFVTTGFNGFRFEFNLARLISSYPSIANFGITIRGRSTTSGTLSGAYSKKGADSGNMKMNGTPGSYVPTTENASDLGTIGFSGKAYPAGADGNIGIAYGADILNLDYEVSSDSLVIV